MTGLSRGLVGVSIAVALFAGGIALARIGVYGWTIFVLFPMILGGLASWIVRPSTGMKAAEAGAFAVMLAGVSLLVVAVEGLLCLVMAMPLAIPLGALGAWLTYRYGAASLEGARGSMMLTLLPAVSLTWDANAPPQTFEVRTEIVIAAPAEDVWKHVVTFSKLPEPREWYFRTGLAYPIAARIDGSGPGAIRYCDFSTGAFVEPIEIWEEPRLLRFAVTENPAPMREWTPYAEISSKHLDGYLVSKRGQFRLTQLPGGRTHLEGATWYQHGLWPAEYWRWWSDAMIHRIHLRVLNHIRTLAEGAKSSAVN